MYNFYRNFKSNFKGRSRSLRHTPNRGQRTSIVILNYYFVVCHVYVSTRVCRSHPTLLLFETVQQLAPTTPAARSFFFYFDDANSSTHFYVPQQPSQPHAINHGSGNGIEFFIGEVYTRVVVEREYSRDFGIIGHHTIV